MTLFTRQNAKAPGSFLGAAYDYWTLQTVKAESNLLDPLVLNRALEVIAINGQPVLLGAIVDGTNQTIRFAIEHTGSWTAATMQASLVANGTTLAPNAAVFTNCTVTLASGL
jgi:hypothetical protein